MCQNDVFSHFFVLTHTGEKPYKCNVASLKQLPVLYFFVYQKTEKCPGFVTYFPYLSPRHILCDDVTKWPFATLLSANVIFYTMMDTFV